MTGLVPVTHVGPRHILLQAKAAAARRGYPAQGHGCPARFLLSREWNCLGSLQQCCAGGTIWCDCRYFIDISIGWLSSPS
jgi:hypothetical protein